MNLELTIHFLALDIKRTYPVNLDNLFAAILIIEKDINVRLTRLHRIG